MMQKTLLVAAVLVIVAFGIVEALWTDRWSLSNESEKAAAKLTAVPLVVGDWVGKDDKLDPRVVARAEMTGYLLRYYTNRESGKTLEVLLVCGRTGPTSVHPPETCFQGAGYTMVGAAVKQESKLPSTEPPADFWVAQFRKPGPSPDPLRLHWSWSSNGTWTASSNPRLTFGGNPFLCKLYVIHALGKADEPVADDPAPEFLRLFLPEVRKSVF
jgi:Protein of unknown function (DUF3485)